VPHGDRPGAHVVGLTVGATGVVLPSVVSTGVAGVMLAVVSVPGSVMSVIMSVVSAVIVVSGVTGGSTGAAMHSAPLGDTRLRQKSNSRSSSLWPATMIAITLIGSRA